jgi:two-component system cell cycle sensor histidine kinase/response regulator CckA
MAETAEDPELADGFHQVLAACRTGSDLTARLVAFSRQQATHRELGSVNAAIRSCAPTIQRWLGSNVDLQLAMAGDPWNVLLDASRIEQALVQLAENARDAMPYGGTVTIRTANVTLPEAVQTVVAVLPPGDYVRIDVIDTGKGIAPEDLHRIFEPLYTTRQQTGLKGLGLCVVHGTIAQHAGGIVVKSVPAQGTTFEIYLPRSVDQRPPAVAAGSAAEPAVASSGEGRCILLAEDEEAVRDVAVRLLEKAAYSVIEAVDGHEAIAKFDEAKDRIDLALLDIVMPEASGAAVAAHIRATSPGTPILFCSGFAKHQLPEGIALPEDIPLIGKPYEPHQLLDAIARLIEPR